MISLVFSLLVTAGASLAVSSQPAAAAPTPQIQSNQQFTLVAKVIKSELGVDVNNWALGGARLGPGQLATILKDVAPLDQLAGRMYQNGTTKDTSCSVGTNNVVAAGTGTTPLSFNIHQAEPPADNSTCTISIAPGTPGVGIVKGSNGVPYFVGNGQLDGQFFVCNFTFWAEPVQTLYWRSANDPAPSGCADIKLVPQCAGNLDDSTLYTQDLVPAPCLDDAVNLDVAHLTENPSGDGQVIVPLLVQG